MATEAHGAEEGGLVFHPMDQFIVKPLFGDGPVAWYTPTNVTLWMALAVVAIIALLVHWLNDELADQRIIVRDILEDIYDGLVIQKLLEKLTGEQWKRRRLARARRLGMRCAGIRIEYPEVAQSEYGQLERLRIVVDVANQILAKPRHWDAPKWTAEMIHQKELVAILHLLIALALHFRAPIRFPEHAQVQILVVQKRDGQLRTR